MCLNFSYLYSHLGTLNACFGIQNNKKIMRSGRVTNNEGGLAAQNARVGAIQISMNEARQMMQEIFDQQ